MNSIQKFQPFSQPKNITFLDDKGIVKFTEKGAIRSMEVDVELSYRSNHFWGCERNVKDKNKQWTTKTDYKLTAEGYEKLNKVAGLKVLPEPNFTIGDQTFTNPAIVMDSTGRKSSVYQKVTLYGYGPDGEIHFSSVLVVYNVMDELISAILAKINYQNSNSKMGVMCPKDAFQTFKKDHPYAMFIPTDDFGDGLIMGIAVDVSNPDFLKLRKDHQDKLTNIEKKVQTVAKRNAFRKHPATSVYSVFPRRKDVGGGKIDLIHHEKMIKWYDVDPEKEAEAIKDYLASERQEEVIKYEETDMDQADPEPGEIIQDENEIILDPEDFDEADEVFGKGENKND